MPSRIDPFRLAEQGATIKGAVPLAQMARLADVLMAREGKAQVVLHFGSEAGLNVVVGQVSAVLPMQCQRCLQPVAKLIDRHFRLVVVRSDTEAARLQAEHEILQVEDDIVSARDLVEDELLLSAPLIPTHDDPAGCDAAMLLRLNDGSTDGADQVARNPFAILKHLKKS